MELVAPETSSELTVDKNQSLLGKFLTPDVEKKLRNVETARGFTLDYITKSGRENPDSSIGVYAPDTTSYKAFGALFEPIIQEYHGHGPNDKHKTDMDPSKLLLKDLDPDGKFVVSTRIRVGRNLVGFCFAPGIGPRERASVESEARTALKTFRGDLSGEYYSLASMKESDRAKLVADHFLFKQGDRFLESAGANRDWPESRGIFHSKDKKFLVWVNEEDHLRIISMEKGGNVHSVFDRLARGVKTLGEKLNFSHSSNLGYLTSCPTNLGTAMRASIHVRLQKLHTRPEFKTICSKLGLSIRGIHGEHSESEGGIYDISNKRRLGISEVEVVNTLALGAQTLIEAEKKLA